MLPPRLYNLLHASIPTKAREEAEWTVGVYEKNGPLLNANLLSDEQEDLMA